MEKKQVNSSTAIAILVIILSLIIAVLGTACVYMRMEINQLQSDLQKTEKQLETMTTNYERAYRNSQIEPYSNGEIINSSLGESVCPLSISVQGSSAYYIYLDCVEYTSSKTSNVDSMEYTELQKKLLELYGSDTDLSIYDLSFMIKPHSTVEILVPLGSYKLYYATGDDWFGPTLLFGEETQYYKAGSVLEFTADKQYYYGHTLELWEQVGGNMTEIEISESDFPN